VDPPESQAGYPIHGALEVVEQMQKYLVFAVLPVLLRKSAARTPREPLAGPSLGRSGVIFKRIGRQARTQPSNRANMTDSL